MILEPSPPKAALDSSSVTRAVSVVSLDSLPSYSEPTARSETTLQSLEPAFKNVRQERSRRRKRVLLIVLAVILYTVALVVFMTQVCSSFSTSSR